MKAFKREWRLFVFLAAVLLFFWLVYLLRGILLPFIIGLVLAYLILPIIHRIERKLPGKRHIKVRRIFLVTATYIIFFGLFAIISFGAFALLRPTITAIATNAPDYWNKIYNNLITSIDKLIAPLLNSISQNALQNVNQFIYNAGLNAITTITTRVKTLTPGSIGITFETIGTVLAVFTMPVFLFYLLKDWETLGPGFYSGMPVSVSEHARHFFSIVDRVAGRFIRAQVFMGIVFASLSLTGLLIIGFPYAPVLAIIEGLGKMIPIVGSWITAIFAIFFTLAVAPEKILWVLLLYLGIQVLENLFLTPRIQGGFLHIHPAIALVLLVLGAYFAGIWGVILILPATATLIEVIKYVRNVLNETRDNKLPPDFII
jgi:predicted PurR-regulated permease PerM